MRLCQLFLLIGTGFAAEQQQPFLAPCARGHGWNGSCSRELSSCTRGGINLEECLVTGKCIVDIQGKRSCGECGPTEVMQKNGVCACYKGHSTVAGVCGINDSPCENAGLDTGCASGLCFDLRGYKRCRDSCPSGQYITKDFLCCRFGEISEHGSCRLPVAIPLKESLIVEKIDVDDERAEILEEQKLDELLE